tara:strand:+ start:1329 stop:1553 length:225 start_codon:yes stop_codon:yes gene_type:complete
MVRWDTDVGHVVNAALPRRAEDMLQCHILMIGAAPFSQNIRLRHKTMMIYLTGSTANVLFAASRGSQESGKGFM